MNMRPIRCKSCTKLLAMANVFDGEIKCRACNYLTHYSLLTESFLEAVKEGEVKTEQPVLH